MYYSLGVVSLLGLPVVPVGSEGGIVSAREGGRGMLEIGRGGIGGGEVVERGPSPGFRCGVEHKCVLRAAAISLTALFLGPRTFSVEAWVVTFTVRALVGEVVCAGVCFVRVGTSATGGSIHAAVATVVAESLTMHAADGFLLRFFGDYASVEYGHTFF